MNEIIDEIISLFSKRRTSLKNKILIGCLLCRIKPILHKGFAKMIQTKLPFSVRMAQYYMNLYRSDGRSTESVNAYKNVIIHSATPKMVVYFIQAQSDYYAGPIKIGYTNKLRQRFITMQMFNFHELRIMKLLEGNKALETVLHHRFAQDRIKGEWFRPSSDLIDYVNSIQEDQSLLLLRQEVMDIKNIFM